MPTDNAITLGAESVRAEIDEAPEVHDLIESQVEHINKLSDEEINAAIQAEVGDAFWSQYDDVRSRVISRLAGDPLVQIVYVTGDDYETAVDEANNRGGSIEAVIEYLSQWDYGDETDFAATVNGYTEREELDRLPHQVHTAEYGGLSYFLQIDHRLGFYALYRRPLGR